MSKTAFKIYGEVLTEQHSRNDARRIRMRVGLARKSPHSAGIRWPFELLQNALDAGPREGRFDVTVRLRYEPNNVVFEHDGAPFSLDELAALLSGGSSKDLESEITTGRFGTGFLVTHILAEKTRLRGLLQLTEGYESFDLTLDRGGDEDAILTNIRHSHEAIRAAVPVTDITNKQSAVFKYASGETDEFAQGLHELKRTLPYLYGTRSTLGLVEFRSCDGVTETWKPSPVKQQMVEGGYMECRTIIVTDQHLTTRVLRVFRFATGKDASGAALVLVEQTDNGSKVNLLETNAPRVFREYPLRSSGFLPFNFVLDGKFDPDQERGGLLMSPNDKHLLEQAFSAGIIAVQYAIKKKWRDAHWLAYAACPKSGFDTTNTKEIKWWTGQLREFARRLAATPIVECETQFLPASGDEPYADFVVPRLLNNSATDETSVYRLWPLVAATDRLLPPKRELAPDWTTIAEGWHSLNQNINMICVSNLTKWVVPADVKTVEELKVQCNAEEWLADFIDIVGECWEKRDGIDTTVLAGMIPDQNSLLRSPSDLKRDGGVSKSLKDICADMGYEVRDELLLNVFEETADLRELNYVNDALAKAIPKKVDEDDVIKQAVEHISDLLPEDKGYEGVPTKVRQTAVRLLAHLWEKKDKAAESTARQVPLLTSSQRAARWSPNRLFMAPERVWPESAQQFALAYPPSRVLDDIYAGSEAEGIVDVSTPLVEWGMAYTDPVIHSTVDIKDRRLEMLNPTVDTNGVVVRQERLSQIALLQPELLNRCQEEIEKARALLGLVLCYVAKRDQGWKERRTVKGRKSGEKVDLCIPPALWLADLKVRAWVPVPGEDDKPQKMVANEATLKYILHPPWLQDNDDAIRLLSEWFGFDQLELRLSGIVQDDTERQELRNSLAKLIETVGPDPQLYTNLADEVEEKVRRAHNVERCRNLGLAVQKAVGVALRAHKLDVKLVDKGFDFEVALQNDDIIHDTGMEFELGSYLVEVKATTTGNAQLTPMQAATAASAKEQYVLCVVDLRENLDTVPEEDWTAYDVETLARLVPNVGDSVGETYDWVKLARKLDVGIRNESALRYEVPAEIWESGVSIADWVKDIKATLS